MASGDEQLISYILKAREKGRMDEDIARSLYSVGWRKERVDAAFAKISEMKEAGEQPEPDKEDAPAKPQQILPGRVRLSAVPVSQVPSQEKPIQKIVPPTVKQAAKQEGQPMPAAPARKPLIQIPPIRRPRLAPEEQGQQEQAVPAQQAPEQEENAEEQPRLVIPPTIQPPEEKAPIELPMAPQYQKVTDESQVQNPAFPKVAGGISTLDFDLIGRVILFVIIIAIVVYAYSYLTSSAPKIS